MLKQIIIIFLMISLFNSCIDQSEEKVFLDKFESESFSQFNGVDMILRGVDKYGNLIIFGFASQLIENSSMVISYTVVLDKDNYQVIKTELGQAEYHFNADTAKLQHLAQLFTQYKIPRLNVDTAGNVFVYLKDFETLALVKFMSESELKKWSKETKWTNVKGKWYKRK